MGIQDLTKDELQRLYGPSDGRVPADAVRLFEGYPGRWWVAGGWAIEAFTGVHRPHSDLDPSVPRAELPLLRRQLAGRLDLWIANIGWLYPLLPDVDQDGPADRVLPEECENLWARPSGAEPWAYDVILMDGDASEWVFKRDGRIRLPWDETIWTVEEIPYLRPEVQLLHKAAGLRDRDQLDFDAAAPLLDTDRRHWLRDALELVHPSHRWIAAL